ncbi:methylated-DNA--[protein]-cysteine S-methyltransferase [Bacillus sp. V5-8f]|uniref:methylated-DNA--[protein]-cysteine S-methyltransferase n=1 Tax=Bacillus sp. V5-8f TaxID=2053044 RepID=UPI000C77605D|nr:methylated-DNA--[protein]-cysteine S-methyltransferase [Bacillus sp. V5-8f]PLT35120.1 cysteine methyltransferase [Bacillus sp. V5-8f]
MKLKDKPAIYYSELEYGEWRIYMAATLKGLCYVGSQDKTFEQLSDWVKRHFPGSLLLLDRVKLQPYKEQLIEYFQGIRLSFTLPFDLRGTSFQRTVWEALGKIPYGQTCSYSDIAQEIQNQKAVRAIGAAIGANPVLITIPCHRVVGKNGRLTGYRDGLEMKEKLLHLEQGNLPVTLKR